MVVVASVAVAVTGRSASPTVSPDQQLTSTWFVAPTSSTTSAASPAASFGGSAQLSPTQPGPTAASNPLGTIVAPPDRGTDTRVVTVVGDSLLLSAAAAVLDLMVAYEVTVDAVSGRTTAQGRGAIAVAAAGATDVLVIALGTNDAATTPADYAAALADIEPLITQLTCVIWVDTQEFAPELSTVNAKLRTAAANLAHAHLARWSALAGPAALHTEDGYHLSDKGQTAYATLITTAISLFCP